jgi:hypothetical protein
MKGDFEMKNPMIKVATKDELMADFLFMYCEGKSALWRLFFGWRNTDKDTYTFYVRKSAKESAHEWATSARWQMRHLEET